MKAPYQNRLSRLYNRCRAQEIAKGRKQFRGCSPTFMKKKFEEFLQTHPDANLDDYDLLRADTTKPLSPTNCQFVQRGGENVVSEDDVDQEPKVSAADVLAKIDDMMLKTTGYHLPSEAKVTCRINSEPIHFPNNFVLYFC
jgi:hypothetical protein